MKQAMFCLALFVLAGAANVFAQDTSNLLTNPGWDTQTGTVTPNDSFDNGTTFPDWQVYALGGEATYTVQADATAPSAPNIFIYSKSAAIADSAVRKDPFPAAVTPGAMYEHSLWIRDTDAELNRVNISTGLFDSTGAFMNIYGGRTAKATATWKKVYSRFVAPANAATASYQIHTPDATGTVQMDSAELKEISLDSSVNLVYNPGFDEEAATVTVGANEATQFDTNNTFSDWQVYAIGNGPAKAIYTTQADPTAKSAPNVMNFQKVGGPADAAIRSEASQFPVLPGHFYKSSIWLRGTANPVHNVVVIFDSASAVVSPLGDAVVDATAAWQKSEASWIAPATASTGSFQLHLYATDATNQFDDASVVDITKENRMTNSGFENSATQPVNWGVVDFNGRGFGASISNDGQNSAQSVRLFQTAATTEGSDGVFAKDTGGYYLPWDGAKNLYLEWSIKDDPTFDTGEDVNVSVVCFDSQKAVISVPAGETHPVTGKWAKYSLTCETMPANTAFISINFRVANGSGTDADKDDVLVDNVKVFDRDQMVVNSVNHWSLY